MKRALLLALFLGCGSVSAAPDGAAGAAGTSASGGAAGTSASAGTTGAAGTASSGGRGGGHGNIGVCTGLPQSDDRYAYLYPCPAGTVLRTALNLSLYDSMDRRLYPCVTCTAMLCVLCADADGGAGANSWCTGSPAEMAPYGTCQ